MSNALERISFNDDQIKLIKSQIAPKASNDELSLFLYQCKRTGLDPMTRQIYAIHRWNAQQGKEVMTIQTSIDGLRVIAERSGKYAGQDEPEYTYTANGELESAKVTVYKFNGNTRYPAAVGVAFMAEYMPLTKDGRPMGLWGKMPRIMLSKVAEALALRKAYPQDLSGIYAEDEMHQADQYTRVVEVTPGQIDYLHQLLSTSTYEEPTRQRLAMKIDSIETEEEFNKALDNLQQNQLDPITQGFGGYNQKDITNHIKSLAE